MDDDEEEIFISDKFYDCKSCRYKFCMMTCDDCDYGENYEEEDPDEVDKFFKGRI